MVRSSYNLYDAQGNLAQVTNGAGVVSPAASYTAWGEVVPRADGTLPSAGGYGAKYGYLFDGESGFYLCTYRHYDPSAGRWITRDPIGYVGGSNLYGYVSNNPNNMTDINGLWGVQFGNGPNIGIGDPTFIFTGEDTVEGLKTGAAATGSALSYGLYDGGKYRCETGFDTSHTLAVIGREAALAAVMAGNGGNVGLSVKQVGTNLSTVGRAGSQGIREVPGGAKHALKLFDALRGSNPVREVAPNVFVAAGKNGGNVTFRAASKSGPPTVDLYGIEAGLRKIKFLRDY